MSDPCDDRPESHLIASNPFLSSGQRQPQFLLTLKIISKLYRKEISSAPSKTMVFGRGVLKRSHSALPLLVGGLTNPQSAESLHIQQGKVNCRRSRREEVTLGGTISDIRGTRHRAEAYAHTTNSVLILKKATKGNRSRSLACISTHLK